MMGSSPKRRAAKTERQLCCNFVTTEIYETCSIVRRKFEGLVMRMIAALAVLSALLALGGCFHHSQVYRAEPQVLPPLK